MAALRRSSTAIWFFVCGHNLPQAKSKTIQTNQGNQPWLSTTVEEWCEKKSDRTVYLEKFAFQEIDPSHVSIAESDHYLSFKAWLGTAPKLKPVSRPPTDRRRLRIRNIPACALHSLWNVFLQTIRDNPKKASTHTIQKDNWL
jgi:hypothetical protein